MTLRNLLVVAAACLALPGAASAEVLQNVRIENQTFPSGLRLEPGSRDVTIVNSRFPSGLVIDEGVQRVHIEGNSFSAPRSNGIIFSASSGDPFVEDVRIVGNKFDDIGVFAVNVRNFRRVTVDRNEIQNVYSWDGVVHTGAVRTYAGGEDLTVADNFFHDNEAQGVFIKDGRVERVRIFNNLIVANAREKVHLQLNLYDAHDVLVANNTIMNNGAGSVIRANSTGVDLRNNLLSSLTVEEADALAYENYNFIGTRKGDLVGWTAKKTGANNIRGGLQFVDPTSFDYSLARGSAGIDAGTSDRAPDFDRLGAPRADVLSVLNTGSGLFGFYDVGAHEVEEPVPAAASSPVLREEEGPRAESRSPLHIAFRAPSTQRLHKGRGLRLRLACSLGCRLDVWLRARIGKRIVSSQHKILGLPPGLFGRATPLFKPRLARALRARLRKYRYVRMTVAVQATDQYGRSTFTSKRIKVVGRRG